MMMMMIYSMANDDINDIFCRGNDVSANDNDMTRNMVMIILMCFMRGSNVHHMVVLRSNRRNDVFDSNDDDIKMMVTSNDERI